MNVINKMHLLTHLLFITRMRIVPLIRTEPAKRNAIEKHHQQTIHTINKQVIFIFHIMPEDEENKLASLEAMLVRNYDPLTQWLNGVVCRATNIAKDLRGDIFLVRCSDEPYEGLF